MKYLDAFGDAVEAIVKFIFGLSIWILLAWLASCVGPLGWLILILFIVGKTSK